MRYSKRKFGLFITPAYRSSAGIEKYGRALLKAIYRSELADRVVLLGARDSPPPGWVESLGCGRPTVARSNLPRRLLQYTWALLGKPTADAMAGEDLAFAHNLFERWIPTKNSPSIMTVHDLYVEKFPQRLTVHQKLVLERPLRSVAMRRANLLIADSHNTERDLIEIARVPPERITVIHLGVDHSVFRRVDDADRARQVLNRYGVGGPFILYLGSLYSRKIGKLLEAYKILCSRWESPPKLVLIGGREMLGVGYKSLSERLAMLNLGGNVIRLGVVPEEALPVFMSAALVFVYVSLYEGFGLGVLEAMACGAPVVVSSTSSLPEVVGDAGLLVDPMNEQEIASAMQRLLDDSSLRDELRRRSMARAALFPWEQTTQQTLDVYRRMLG